MQNGGLNRSNEEGRWLMVAGYENLTPHLALWETDGGSGMF